MARPFLARCATVRLLACLTGPFVLAGCGDDGGGTGGTTGGTTDGSGTTASTTTGNTSTGGGSTAATGSGSGDTGVPAYSHADDIQPIWDANCVQGCHDSACATPGTCDPLDQNLDLQLDGDGYDDLVDKMSVQNPSMLRVKPGDPENSYLWHKIAGTHETVCMGNCGQQMPKGAMPLDDATQQMIYDWIAGGANP
ncbi:MAG: hypothetical protein D6705_16400 [Deltaproteobacteria bacterium]|nr:MAG: hypothetical protein D6705_16400 [Deltaproteobacteria bacterium]